jgi:hypothetical protein
MSVEDSYWELVKDDIGEALKVGWKSESAVFMMWFQEVISTNFFEQERRTGMRKTVIY